MEYVLENVVYLSMLSTNIYVPVTRNTTEVKTVEKKSLPSWKLHFGGDSQ